MAHACTAGSATLNPIDLNALILGVYRLGGEVPYDAFESAVLEHLQAFIRFDSAWWGTASADPEEIHRLHLHNCDASILEAYRPYMDQDFFRAALIAQPGRSINMADLTAKAPYVASALYRKVGKRYKIACSLGTLLVEPVSSLYEFLTLWRHDFSTPFTEAERQTKELLMPHIVQAHKASLLAAVLGQPGKHAAAWAISDERGFLRQTTPEFMHKLRAYWPAWQGSRLPDVLLESVKSATNWVSPKARLAISQMSSLRYIEVQVTSSLDTLSPREREIAQRYARGETHALIASALALAPATVRNHLARCYRKLTVNNKYELALRLQSLSGANG